MFRFRPSVPVVDAVVAHGAQPRDTGVSFFFVLAVRSLHWLQRRFVHRASRLGACFSSGASAVLCRGGLLVFLSIAVALSQDAALAQGALTNGAKHTGVIQVGGLDTWTIPASFNDSITVRIGEVLGSGPDPNFWPRIRLRGPDGASLGDDYGSNAAEIDVRAPLTGTYTVLVSSSTFFTQASSGSYVLTVAKTPGPYSVSSGDEGGPITNGATHVGVIQVGDLDPWTFQAAFNDSITVRIGEVLGSGPDPNFWPRIRLRGPDGASLGDDYGSNAAEIDVRAPQTGTYTVLVSSSTFFTQAGSGSYVLTVAKTPGPYNVSSGDEGGPITNSAAHAGVIQVGDLDPWTFQAASNASITVRIGEVGGGGSDPNFWPRIRLRGPDGASLGDDYGSNAAEIDVQAPLTGTYTVLVSSSTFFTQAGSGSYTLTVSGLTAVSPPVVNAFTANPLTINAGQSSTLSWTTTNATTVSISGIAGTQPANGSVSVSPTATTNYTLTATGAGGTASATTQVTVVAPTGFSVAGILAVVGSTQGNGAFFRTGIQIYNPRTSSISGKFVFHTQGVSGSANDPSLTYTLSGGQTLDYPDLLPAMGISSGLGSLDIMTTGDPVPIMSARVFSDFGDNGTNGLFIDPLAPDAALQAGDSGVIIAPSDPLKARLNLGIRSLETGASFQITVRNKNGVVRNTVSKNYGATFFEQVNANTYAGVTLDGSDTITFSMNSGKAIIYGSQTDNKTQDPSVQYAKKTF
jgi:hypothetical protein